MNRLRRRLGLSLAFGCLLLAGCMTESKQGKSRTDQLVEQPEEFSLYAVVQMVDPAVDSNNDGQIDAIPVVVHLIADTAEWDTLAVWVPGEFEFTLTGSDQKEIARWSFTPGEVERMRTVTQVGRAYRVVLRLRDAEVAPERETRAGGLSCRFIPVEGEPVKSEKVVSVIIGGAGWRDSP